MENALNKARRLIFEGKEFQFEPPGKLVAQITKSGNDIGHIIKQHMPKEKKREKKIETDDPDQDTEMGPDEATL